MPARGLVHIASSAARASGHRIGHTTRCGAPLVDVPFYFDAPTHEDLIEETCVTCLEHARKEKRDAQKTHAARLTRKARAASAPRAEREDQGPGSSGGDDNAAA